MAFRVRIVVNGKRDDRSRASVLNDIITHLDLKALTKKGTQWHFLYVRRTGNEKACLQKQLLGREHVKEFLLQILNQD